MNNFFTNFDPTFLLLIGFFVLIYFLMIRPENKRRKAHQQLVNDIEIVTKIGDEYFDITLGSNIKVKIQRASISNVLPKGTINSI